MSSAGIMIMLRGCCRTNPATVVSGFHTTSGTYLDQYWRQKKGLPTNPNASGPLLNLPDFSYKDNRPSPYGSHQLQRIKKNQQYAERVLQLIGEVDYAVERHARMLKEEKEKKQQILDSKLKPKGTALIENE